MLLLILFCPIDRTLAQKTGDLNIIPRELWHAETPRSFLYHVPERITIHHEGEFFDTLKQSAPEEILRVQRWGMSEARNWVDIPYHYLIDFSGKIYEGRNVFTVGETNTDYNPSGHLLISLLGNFEEQEVPILQLQSLIKLLVYCCNKFDIPPDLIHSHRDYAETLCPGKNLYKYIENGFILSSVKAAIKK